MALSKQLEGPCHFILGAGVLLAYVPGIIGAAISTGWLFLLLVTPPLLFFYKAKIKDTHVLGLVFLILASLSLAWTENLNVGVFYLFQLYALGAVFYIGSATTNLNWIVHGLGFGLAVNSVTAIFQYFNVYYVYTNQDDIAGLLVNKNIYCELSAILFIIFVLFKFWWWIPVTLPGLILIHSRAAMLALGLFFVSYLYKLNKRLTIVGGIVLTLLATVFYWNKFNILSIQERFGLWTDTIRGLKPFGNGVGSYEILYPKFAFSVDTLLARPKFAHNDLLQAAFEFGILIIPLVMLIYNVITIKSKYQLALWSILVISLFTYPFHTPASAFIWFVFAGFVVRNGSADSLVRNLWGSDLSKGAKRK